MIKHAIALAGALTIGALGAQAESMISADGLKATQGAVKINSVTAEKPGYVVVHRTDVTGTIPGTVIGHAPVVAGDNAEVSVVLNPVPEAGTTLIVMLHAEGDGDSDFDSADKPVTSGRSPVQQSVTVE